MLNLQKLITNWNTFQIYSHIGGDSNINKDQVCKCTLVNEYNIYIFLFRFLIEVIQIRSILIFLLFSLLFKKILALYCCCFG